MADYIEREKTVELLRSLGDRGYRREKGTIQDAIKMISFPEYTPTADVAPVVNGRWKVIEGTIENAVCSNCGRHFQSYYEAYHYCPNCGARMDLGDKNND